MKNLSPIVATYFTILLFITTQHINCKEVKTTTPALQEKIIITTDRTIYLPGEQVLVSGFVLNAADHSLRANEYILHLCLYSNIGELKKHELFFIKNGSFKGQVEIPAVARKGLYRVVAYTNYMRNWGDNNLFEKLIWVDNEESATNFTVNYEWQKGIKQDSLLVFIKKEGVNSIDKLFMNISTDLYTDQEKPMSNSLLSNTPETFIAIPFKAKEETNTMMLHVEMVEEKETSSRDILIQKQKGEPDIQFMPESGTLLDNVDQLIAFKAIGVDGFPIDVWGTITDPTGKEMARISTEFDGMGSFNLAPKSGMVYTANIEDESGNSYSYTLPKSQTTGATINVKRDGDKLTLNIYKSGLSDSLRVITHCRNNILYTRQLTNSQYQKIPIDISNLPYGIIHFTLVNGIDQPLCERLVFHRPSKTIEVTFPNFKTTYNSRSKVNLPVKIDHISPKNIAIYNVSVSNDALNNNFLQQTAETQLYLTSELPGFIPNANYYLQDNPLSERAVNLLMLTNGWCSYNFDIPTKTLENLAFEPETNINIKGEIRHILTNKPLKNNLAQGVFYGGGNSITKTVSTDKNGRFKFEFPDIDYNLKGNLVFSPKKGGTPRDVRATIKSLTEEMELDYAKTDVVLYKKSTAPESKELIADRLDFSSNTEQISKVTKLKVPREDTYYEAGQDTLTLPTIEIKEKHIVSSREKMRNLFGIPRTITTNKQVLAAAKSVPWYSSIWELIGVLYPELDNSISAFLSLDFTTVIDITRLTPCQLESLLIDFRRTEHMEFTYAIKSSKEQDRPIFIVVDGRRILAHENPYLFNDPFDIKSKITVFKSISPSEITAIELFDCHQNYDEFLTPYETSIYSAEMIYDEFECKTSTYEYAYNFAFNTPVIQKNLGSISPLILSITTKGGEGSWGNQRKTVAEVDVTGFSKVKKAYKPNYSTSSSDIKEDKRNTLYWNPIALNRPNDVKNFNFYTSDIVGKSRVMINGITSDGTPFYGDTIITTGAITKPDSLPTIEMAEPDTITKTVIRNNYIHTDGAKSVAKAIRYCIGQIDGSLINTSFFREKFYQNSNLMSIEEWQIKSKPLASITTKDAIKIEMQNGKSYKTFDFREKIDVLPNHRETSFPYSADPFFMGKPFLNLDEIKYYNFAIIGETMQENRLCYEILFDVKKEVFMAGFRGKLIIGKDEPFIYEATYGISPTNRDFLDLSYFVNDIPEKYDLELVETNYIARYNCQKNRFYPLELSEEICFSINKKVQQTFTRQLLTSNVSEKESFKPRTIDETEMKSYLVKNPLYDKTYFGSLKAIDLPKDDLDEMHYLHEITNYR